MAGDAKSSNNASVTHLIANVFGKEALANINIQMSSKAVCNEIMNTSFSSAFITPLNNIFVPFSTDNEDYPSLLKDDSIEDPNRNRDDEIDYEDIDGLDFNVLANKYSYHKPFGIDYEAIPTIGDGPGQNNTEGLSDYDLNTRNYDYNDEFRTVGFKTPMYFAGWGLDTAGRPVPSVYDEQKKNEEFNNFDNIFVQSYQSGNKGEIDYLYNSEESGDVFQLELKKNTYTESYNVNPSEWPAGPLDIRWDRYRGVWAACPVIIEGYLLEDLIRPSGRASEMKYSSGEMAIYTGHHEDWDAVQPMQKAWVINRCVGLTASSGTYIAAQFFPNGEYRPIWVDCIVDPSGAVNTGRIPKAATKTKPEVTYDGGGIVR